jgi:hypothetical protein
VRTIANKFLKDPVTIDLVGSDGSTAGAFILPLPAQQHHRIVHFAASSCTAAAQHSTTLFCTLASQSLRRRVVTACQVES